jgi:hypothetical protein
MALGYVTTLRNSRLNAITTAVGTSGKLRVYSGTKPAVGGAETTTLATLTCSATFAPAAAAGVLTANAITSATAVASGTPTWARLMTSADAAVIDMTAAVGSGDLNFNAAIVSGGTVACSSFVITDGTP